ncbi:MAG: type II toxin-antitoxin system Phd/YefM family antitoxin [Candidatus Marinimicrobia bacterium]|nr:type II toxin-antitoxin system Phd/YefM family antitoxin [Candidatus Neomarinimicrobiota bacterium]
MLNNLWQLQEAKNKFSSLVDKAKNSGPQIVTKHGEEAVVVLDISEYKKLLKPKMNLVQFFQNSPLATDDLNLERNKELPREIAL